MSNATRNIPPAAPIATQRELASRLQRSPSRVCRWMKRHDWPFGSPPWPASIVVRVREWADATLREGIDHDPQLTALRVEKLKQEIRRLSAMAAGAEADNTARLNNLYLADDVRAEFKRSGDRIRDAFLATPARVAAVAIARGMPVDCAADFEAQARASVEAILAPLDRPFRMGQPLASDGDANHDDDRDDHVHDDGAGDDD